MICASCTLLLTYVPRENVDMASPQPFGWSTFSVLLFSEVADVQGTRQMLRRNN
jgi:hypothetical protein